MNRIFVSYSSKDQAIVERFCQVFDTFGLDYWIASRHVRPGANYQEEIVTALTESTAVLVFFSANAASSNQVLKEIAIADKDKLLIVPIRIDSSEPSGPYRYELSTRQWIDAFPLSSENINACVRRLRDLVPTREATTPTAAVPNQLTGVSPRVSLGDLRQVGGALSPNRQERYNQAVTRGKEILSANGSKADAARAIFALIDDEPRNIVIKAFIEGALLTPNGASTYHYNISRERNKSGH
jgi:hypothetical protein